MVGSVMSSIAPKVVDGNYNFTAKTCFIVNPKSRLAWFLIASYCYYQCYASILTDEVFDGIVLWLQEHLEEISHPHVGLVDQEMLSAGTAYNIRDYPTIVRNCGDDLVAGIERWRCSKEQ
jgi:hypothetical protein